MKGKFRQFCWNCILSVPRTFWGVFIQNVLVFQFSLVFQAKFFDLPAEIIQQSSKMLFEPKLFELCEAFQQNRQKGILNVQRNTLTKTKCWMCETIADFGQGNVGFAAESLQPCYQFCLRMGNWKNSFERIFTFCDFFRTSREHFLVFSLYHSRHGGPNWIPPAKRNISIKKYFRENFLSFPDYGRNFLNSRWSLLGMLSKLQFTCSQEHFQKGYLFRIFQTCFRTLIDNRPELWRKCSAALPKLHSTCRNNFSIFFAKFCRVSFNFVFERKKS